MFVSGSESLGNSVPVYCSGSTSFDVRSWKISLKNFQGLLSIVQLSMFFLLLPFHATAFILYQSVSCLSTTFLFLFLLLWSSSSRDSFNRITHPSELVNSFLISFCNLLFSKFSSEYSHTHARIFMQNFLFFIRSASACHSLVSVSASEHMVSYHGFPELSMLFLYFAQFRIFWHQFSHPYSQTDFMLAWKDGWLYNYTYTDEMSATLWAK